MLVTNQLACFMRFTFLGNESDSVRCGSCPNLWPQLPAVNVPPHSSHSRRALAARFRDLRNTTVGLLVMPGYHAEEREVRLLTEICLDGSNIYHALKATYGTAKYDVVKLEQELAAGRSLAQINYYIAQVNRAMGKILDSDQQRFFARLKQIQEIRLWVGTPGGRQS